MRVLAIAPQPFFSPRGTPFSVYYRTSVMAEAGLEIDLLTYGEGSDVDIPGVRIIRIPRFRRLGDVKVGPSPLKLFLDGFVLLYAFVLMQKNRYDVVHAHEEAVFFCRYLKPVFGFKLIYDMHSSLPQQLTNFAFTESRALIGTFRELEDTCLRNADAVITICPELAHYAEPRMPDPAKHVLIENSIFDDVRLRDDGGPRPDPGEWDEHIPADRPVVFYAGTFEPYQGLDVLIEGFAGVRVDGPAPFLLMLGGSPEQVERYRAVATRLGIMDRTLFTGRVAPAVARGLQRCAAVLTSPRIEGNNTPLKIYEQLASGIPLVATRILSHTQVLDESVCFLADPDASSIATAIASALTDRERAGRVVAAARALYDEHYSRPAYERKIARILELVR